MLPQPPPLTFTTGFPGLPSAPANREDYARRAHAFRASLRRKAQLKRAVINLPIEPVDHPPYHAQIRKDLSLVAMYQAARVSGRVARRLPIRCSNAWTGITMESSTKRNSRKALAG